MATTARHQEISAHFLEHAEEEFRKGELLQASEKTWGALAHCVKAIAKKRGWRNRAHRDITNNALRLIGQTDDPRRNRTLLAAMNALHVNFYEDTYEDHPQMVADGIQNARELIEALRIADSRLPPTGNGSRG